MVLTHIKMIFPWPIDSWHKDVRGLTTDWNVHGDGVGLVEVGAAVLVGQRVAVGATNGGRA
jgi:hypothetical protein